MKRVVKWVVIVGWLVQCFGYGATCLRATNMNVEIGAFFIIAAMLGTIGILQLWQVS